jgi:phosphatidylglycerol:prolipoprotein diacylglycerol transferase
MNFLQTFHPPAIALHLGTITVHWYGIILASALIIGFLIALYTSKQKQVDREHLYNLFLLLVIFGVIGGRIAHVVTDWSYYRDHLIDIVKIWQGGLALHGVLVAGLVTVYFYSKAKKIYFWLMTDIIIVALPLMQALGRWGNYFNQELFGKPTGAAWGIPINLVNRPAGFEQFSYFHPLFLYESFLNLIIFVVLLVLFRKNRLPAGRLTLLYFILYSMVRFSLDFLRLEPASIGPLSWGQWASIVLVIGAIACWLFLCRKDPEKI